MGLSKSLKLECNKASYETLLVERREEGVVWLKAQSGKYLNASGGAIMADSDTPTDFYIELRHPTKILIRTATHGYLNAHKNGQTALDNNQFLWDF